MVMRLIKCINIEIRFCRNLARSTYEEMVNDLNNKKERMIQLKNFLPRMKKWDYLLVSSDLNKKLFESAFQTSKNPKLNILNYGAPRNTYLLK